MSAIAKILARKEYVITGSDLKKTTFQNITTYTGHHKNNIKGVDIIVISTDIPSSNPELIEAQRQNLPILKRADILREIINTYPHVVSISGTHGKTTTTALVSSVLKQTDFNPTIINGGIMNDANSNIDIGGNECCVIEADESDGSMLKLYGTHSIVTNIDEEHLSHYGSLENLKKSFIDYMNNTTHTVIACIDDPILKSLLPEVKTKVITYGTSAEAIVQAYNIRKFSDKTIFDVNIKAPLSPKMLYDIELSALGHHNILNALSTIALGQVLDIKDKAIYNGLKSFQGVQRRFSIRKIVNGVTFVDDYAHHPKELLAVLDIAKQRKAKKVIGVFEAHRYTRLQDLMDDFAKALNEFDHVIMIPIYTANEPPIQGVSIDVLCQKFTSPYDKVITQEELNTLISKITHTGDYVIFMGAGNIVNWSKNLLEKIG